MNDHLAELFVRLEQLRKLPPRHQRLEDVRPQLAVFNAFLSDGVVLSVAPAVVLEPRFFGAQAFACTAFADRSSRFHGGRAAPFRRFALAAAGVAFGSNWRKRVLLVVARSRSRATPTLGRSPHRLRRGVGGWSIQRTMLSWSTCIVYGSMHPTSVP